jgi:hypothetical protein
LGMASAALRPSTIATRYFTLLSAQTPCLMHPALKSSYERCRFLSCWRLPLSTRF